MKFLRRSKFLVFLVQDKKTFDAASLLRGELSTSYQTVCQIISGLTGSTVSLQLRDALTLAQFPEHQWTAIEESPISSAATLQTLVECAALLVREPQSQQQRSFLEAENAANDSWWAPLALCYYRRSNQRPAEGPATDRLPYRQQLIIADDLADKFVESAKEPPSPYYQVSSSCGTPTPLRDSNWKNSNLGTLLLRRRTNRIMDRDAALDFSQLSALLESTLRPHSALNLGSSFSMLRKTSPSGGSTHPIEVFVSAPSVEQLTSGIYHYSTERNQLTPVAHVSAGHLRSLNVRFARDQDFVGDAAALLIFVARFPRHHWKYRNEPRSLSVIYTDLGHLSQTLYLMAAAFDLAAFYSGAIDPDLIALSLSLNAISEGPLGVFGLGHQSSGEIQELRPQPISS